MVVGIPFSTPTFRSRGFTPLASLAPDIVHPELRRSAQRSPPGAGSHRWSQSHSQLCNWQLSGVYRYQSGQPYNISFSIPNVGTANLTGAADLETSRIVLLGNPGNGHSSDPYRQLDVSMFTVPKPGSLGLESGRNFLRRAPIDNWDLSITKLIRIKERATFELRLDAFNAFNHTQFDAVNTTLNVTSLTNPTPTILPFNAAGVLVNANGFGTISSVHPPRNLQLSGHFIF